MADYSKKTVPMLISKLTTAIVTSQRSRDGLDAWRRREEIKDALVARRSEAVEPVLEWLRRHADDICDHAAEVLGHIGAAESVVPLAQILAEPYPQRTKRAAAKALEMMRTPEATLAVNLWRQRVDNVREQARAFIRDSQASDDFRQRLNAIAEFHRATPERVADAYLLLTEPQTLSIDAQARLTALPLSPEQCAQLEEAHTVGR